MHVTPEGFTFLPGTERKTATAHVFEVTHRDGGGLVYVCKRVGPRASDEEWIRRRLVAEGDILRRLGGKGTPELFAAGEDPAGPWIVMGRVAGHTLREHMGKMDARWVERAARAAFGALSHLHAEGVVHADVNPDNVIVAEDAHAATLLDLGLARWPGAPPMPPGPFRGTLAYTAPEEARGETLDGRADLFALAATLLHVHSGQLPRPQETDAAMLAAAGDESLEPWARRAATGLSPAAAEVLVRCCAFERAARPANAEAVVERLTS